MTKKLSFPKKNKFKVPSTVNRVPMKLSASYMVFRERMTSATGFCFKQQSFITGGWYSVPRSSEEHQRRLLQLNETIDGLLARGK